MTTTERSPITTHILDVSLGKPAAGVSVRLAELEADVFLERAQARTDADGRITTLLPPGSLAKGTYRLSFDVGAYFAASSRPAFYPSIDVVFVVEHPDQHHHVPLLLSPFGYSTYRGS
jgi:5-hydroxyisourate hydrolase